MSNDCNQQTSFFMTSAPGGISSPNGALEFLLSLDNGNQIYKDIWVSRQSYLDSRKQGRVERRREQKSLFFPRGG